MILTCKMFLKSVDLHGFKNEIELENACSHDLSSAARSYVCR